LTDTEDNFYLTFMPVVICKPLCATYNASVREGYVPPIWKQADTIPAPKVNPPRSLQSDFRFSEFLADIVCFID